VGSGLCRGQMYPLAGQNWDFTGQFRCRSKIPRSASLAATVGSLMNHPHPIRQASRSLRPLSCEHRNRGQQHDEFGFEVLNARLPRRSLPHPSRATNGKKATFVPWRRAAAASSAALTQPNRAAPAMAAASSRHVAALSRANFGFRARGGCHSQGDAYGRLEEKRGSCRRGGNFP